MKEIKNNLRDRSPEERSMIARMGGIASGKARRERATMREQAKEILATVIKENGKEETIAKHGMMAIATKYLSGDVKAGEFLRDTAGEKPTDRMQIETELDLAHQREEEDRRVYQVCYMLGGVEIEERDQRLLRILTRLSVECGITNEELDQILTEELDQSLEGIEAKTDV